MATRRQESDREFNELLKSLLAPDEEVWAAVPRCVRRYDALHPTAGIAVTDHRVLIFTYRIEAIGRWRKDYQPALRSEHPAVDVRVVAYRRPRFDDFSSATVQLALRIGGQSESFWWGGWKPSPSETFNEVVAALGGCSSYPNGDRVEPRQPRAHHHPPDLLQRVHRVEETIGASHDATAALAARRTDNASFDSSARAAPK